MSWLPDNAHSLAVGTAMGWVKVYDTRTSNQTGASCSILAHPAPRPRKIRGIRPDPFRPYLFASYSDFPGDVVKIWDLRKVANPTSKSVVPPSFVIVPTSANAAVSPHSGNFSSQFASSMGGDAEAVVDAAWSTARAGVMAVATSQRPCVSFYSTSTISGTSQMPIYSVDVPGPVQVNGLAWQMGMSNVSAPSETMAQLSINTGNNSPLQADRKSVIVSMTEQQQSQLGSATAPSWESFRGDEELRTGGYSSIIKAATNAFPSLTQTGKDVTIGQQPRLLVALSSSGASSSGSSAGFAEVEVLDRLPLAVSAAGGLLAVNTARGKTVALSSTSISKVQCEQFGAQRDDTNSHSALYHCIDIGEMMRNRCLAGYSADAYANLDVLAEELDAVYSDFSRRNTQNHSLVSVAVANTKAVYRTWAWMDRFETTVNEAGLTVSNCGVLEVLVRNQLQHSASNFRQISQHRSVRHPSLGAIVYTSDGRDLSKKLCGWVKMFGLGKADPIELISRSSSGSVKGKSGGASSTSTRAGIDSEQAQGADTGAEDDLLEVIVDELFLDSFERAAAIALWHGRIDLAVNVLRRAIAHMEDSRAHCSQRLETAKSRTRSFELGEDGHPQQKVLWDAPYSAGYLQTVSLVAMCFAGYHCPAAVQDRPISPGKAQSTSTVYQAAKVAATASSLSTWASMCKHVVSQLQHSPRDATGYLAAACHFLLASSGQSDEASGEDGLTAAKMFASIIDDPLLTLEDRIAFACTYLNDAEVVNWLETTVEKCSATGNLEAVIITGLSDAGLSILQNYIDRFDDVQTVALLVSRVIDSQQAQSSADAAVGASVGAGGSSVTYTPTREWMWLHEYRNLLNKWEMFIERAYLDVELGKRYRRKAAMISNAAAASASAGKERGGVPAGPGKRNAPKGPPVASAQNQQQNKSKAARVLYRLPVHSDYPHFYLRCGFCGASLPVDGMQNVRPEQLRVQNNVLNCCAACSKQLPRCYVCQLYMVSTVCYNVLYCIFLKRFMIVLGNGQPIP